MSIEEFNLKWLEYMKGVDIMAVTHCPNGHRLVVYNAILDNNERIITCPKGDCDYYDYNTFRVPKDKPISSGIKRLKL